jgi:hypothetical protein
MAAPQSGQRATTAWEAVIGTTPEDNIHPTYYLQQKLKDDGGYKSIDGGKTVNVPLEYALNPNVGWIGETDTVGTAVPDIFDEAIYNWKFLAGAVAHTEVEKAINQGSGKKTDLLEGKLKNLDMSLKKAVNDMLFGAASGNIPSGLTDLVPTNPATGTVGGINRATFAFFRSQQTSGAKTTTAFDNLRGTLDSIYNSCAQGYMGVTPSFCVTTQTVFQGYHSLLIPNERYGRESSSDKGISGFKGQLLQFKDITISYDAACSSGVAYLLNGKFLKLAYAKGFWMKAYEPVDPANQFGDVFKVLTVCVPVLTNSRKVGCVTGIT